MKKLFLLFVMSLCITFSYGMQSENEQTASEKYSELSTYDLLKMCVEYPRIIDVFAYDDINRGFRIVSRKYDGFSQLYSRKDIGKTIIEMFDELPTIFEKASSAKEKLRVTFTYMILELIISQESVRNNIDEREREQLSASAEKAKTAMKDYLGLFRVNSRYTVGTIYTPNQTPVEVEDWDDFNDSLRASSDSIFISSYPNAIFVGSSTATYNCHAYAWYMRGDTTMVHYWLGKPSNYYADSTFVETNDPSEAEIVAYVVDSIIDHSARRIGNNQYISKWAAGPLMIHSLTHCPYRADSCIYFKRAYPNLSGATVPSTPSVYTIHKIPSSFTINWSFTGTIPSGIMTGNSPSNTQCTINNSNAAYINGTLKANIYNSSRYVTTLSKTIKSGDGFTAYYSSSGAFPSTTGSISDGGTINIRSGYQLSIFSPDFANHTLLYSGNALHGVTNNGNGTITLALVNSQPASTSIVTVDGVSGCHHFRFKIYVVSGMNLTDSSLELSQEGNTCQITLNPEYEIDESVDPKLIPYIEDNQSIAWNLLVVNAYTGEVVAEESVVGDSKSLDTSMWKSGVYIFKVQMGDQSVEKKISMK